MKAETGLNCSVGIGTSRLIAKVSSAQAKPNGVLWIVPGEEAKFLAPLDVREIPGVGKVMEKPSARAGHQESRRPCAPWKNPNSKTASASGAWRLPGKPAAKMPEDGSIPKSAPIVDAKSISHEHTYNEDTADVSQLEATLMRLSEMVGRRLRECELLRAHHSTQTALQRFHDHHARAYSADADATRH